MRVRVQLVLAVVLVVSTGFVIAGDRVIGPESFVGDLRLTSENLRIEGETEVKGNIFIEEGDLFIGCEVDIVGSITIKKGNIFIKDDVDITKMVVVDHGDVTAGDKVRFGAGIKCSEGKLKIGANGDVQGNVWATNVAQGTGTVVHGTIHTPTP